MVPKLHYISQGSSPEEHLENIQKACNSGAELVQLRLKNVSSGPADSSEKKFLEMVNEVREITSHFQIRLIINDHKFGFKSFGKTSYWLRDYRMK